MNKTLRCPDLTGFSHFLGESLISHVKKINCLSDPPPPNFFKLNTIAQLSLTLIPLFFILTLWIPVLLLLVWTLIFYQECLICFEWCFKLYFFICARYIFVHETQYILHVARGINHVWSRQTMLIAFVCF